MSEDLKFCRKCGETKPLTEFYSCQANQDRIANWCKRCAWAGIKEPTINSRLYQRLGGRIYAALSGRASKSFRTAELTGCSIENLKLWLAQKFQPGMTWENFGEWHIDHIRPCSSFDLTCPQQQRHCFHYTNLQPLWARDNLRKGAKWNH